MIYDFSKVHDLLQGDLWVTAADAIVTRRTVPSEAIVGIMDSVTSTTVWDNNEYKPYHPVPESPGGTHGAASSSGTSGPEATSG